MNTHTYNNVQPTDTPAYVANGMIGLRVPPIPCLARTAFVQGYVGFGPADRVEEMLPVLYPLGVSCGPEIDRATHNFYVKTMSGYYGAPMSSSHCAVWAARIA